MQDHAAFPYLREIVVFLIAAGVILPVFHRLRVSPVLGYLIVGALIGPYGLGLLAEDVEWLAAAVISDVDGVQALAELGVIFLLFMIGMELSLERLWAMRRLVFGLGSAQILVTSAIIAVIAWRFGNSPGAATVFGACLALSSTAIVMQLLQEKRRVGSALGRSSFSVLLMQDLAVVPILFLVGALSAKTDNTISLGIGLASALGKAALAILAIYLAGRLVLRPLLRLVAQAKSPEMFMAVVLLTVIGTAAMTGAAGVSMALGAFLAGLLLAESEFRHEIEVDIEPFKGLMLGLFFMSVGMGIDYRVIGAEPFWIIASAIGLLLLKATITTGLCLLFGLARHTAVEAGLLLSQAGEFAFVVVGLAMKLGLVASDVGQFMLIVAGLTMITTPFISAAAARLAASLERQAAGRGDDAAMEHLHELEGHIILAGYGRVGQTLARTLEAEELPYVALDSDPTTVALARKSGLPVFFGDASRIDMLRRTNADRAQAIAITMDSPAAAEEIVRRIRAEWPTIPIYARARDSMHASRMLEAGATHAVPETVETSLQLAGRLLSGFGLGEDMVRRRIDAQRSQELSDLEPESPKDSR